MGRGWGRVSSASGPLETLAGWPRLLWWASPCFVMLWCWDVLCRGEGGREKGGLPFITLRCVVLWLLLTTWSCCAVMCCVGRLLFRYAVVLCVTWRPCRASSYCVVLCGNLLCFTVLCCVLCGYLLMLYAVLSCAAAACCVASL